MATNKDIIDRIDMMRDELSYYHVDMHETSPTYEIPEPEPEPLHITAFIISLVITIAFFIACIFAFNYIHPIT